MHWARTKATRGFDVVAHSLSCHIGPILSGVKADILLEFIEASNLFMMATA